MPSNSSDNRGKRNDISNELAIDTDKNDSSYINNQIRYFIPNLVTILAICAGITSIKFAFDGRDQVAILLVIVAALLDGFDGRIARVLGVSSPFGAQLDSLADAINFGTAPALLLYCFALDSAPRFGWVAVLVYAIACCLRLARFNVMMEDKNIPKWKSD